MWLNRVIPKLMMGVMALALILPSVMYLGMGQLYVNAVDTPKYWVGGTGNWSDDDNHWALASGGAPGNGNIPDTDDTVYFDAASFTGAGQIVTVDAAAYCGAMDWTGSTDTPTLACTTYILSYTGNVTLIAAMVVTGTSGSLTYTGAGASTFTTNGLSLGCRFRVDGTGSITLQDNLTVTNTGLFVVNKGTFATGNKNVTCSGSLDSANSNTRTITLGSSTVTMAGWDISVKTNLTFTANTSTINITGTGVFYGGGGN